MTCLEAQDLMAGFIAGALAEASRAALKGHLDACPGCAASERRLRTTWDFLGALEIPPMPLDLGQRLRAAAPVQPSPLVPEPPPPPVQMGSKRIALAASGAALALLAGGLFLWKPRVLFPGNEVPAAAPLPPKPEPPPPAPWSNPGGEVLHLVSIRGADLWASSGSRGAVDQNTGRLILDKGVVWGRALEGEKLRLEAAGWQATVLRGTFTASASGPVAALTCHEGFLKVDKGPGYEGPLAVPEGSSMLLMPGRLPVGPRPARSPYPGEPSPAGPGEGWWRGLGKGKGD